MPQPVGPATDVTPSEEELRACCAADAWLARVQQGRPYADADELVAASDAAVHGLDGAALEQALAAHARIGERRSGEDTEARWSRTEQSGALEAGHDLTRRLAEGNRRYRERFGQVFLIRAAGRSAEEMLAALEERLDNDPAAEQEVVRGELADIVRLRLERLVADGAQPDAGEGGR